MKILHSADWHLDTPFTGRTEAQAATLRHALLQIPDKLAALCRQEQCDLMLLSGDIFDGSYTAESLNRLRSALEEAAVPVFISPGNHDFCDTNSPYLTEVWPENVHIFTNPQIQSVVVEELDCRVYGAGYRSMDCGSLLDGFRAYGDERYHIALLHGDPTQRNSPYCPITAPQVQESGLHYLALGHIHKNGSFRAGETLCAWPGCPMGRGYDEQGVMGCLSVTLDELAHARFLPLDTPRFYDLQAEVSGDPVHTLQTLLPATADGHFYRITLTGEAEGLNLDDLSAAFSSFPNLELRDRTIPVADLWGSADGDSLEGVYFGMLKAALQDADPAGAELLTLAARLSRRILDGREVVLP